MTSPDVRPLGETVHLEQDNLDSLTAVTLPASPDEALSPLRRVAGSLREGTAVSITRHGPPNGPEIYRYSGATIDGLIDPGGIFSSEDVTALFTGLFPQESQMPRSRFLDNRATYARVTSAKKAGREVALIPPV